jgi:hypothetical protein
VLTEYPQALLTGFIGCMICVVVEAAMVGAYVDVPSPSLSGQKVAIVAIMLCVFSLLPPPLSYQYSPLTPPSPPSFVFFYGLFIDAASFIYSAEILPTNIRPHGVALATTTYFIACITFVTPGATAIAAIGYGYFVLFACLTLVSIVVIYFMYPETKGKSLEELAELFGERVVVGLTEGTGEEKGEMAEERVERVERV